MKKIIAFSVFIFYCAALNAQNSNVNPITLIPSARQLQWSNMEFYLFTHFGPYTLTDLEWGKGTEP
jgi:hypothetical protein